MAAYDYGGGCPCGLYRECPPGCEHYVPEKIVYVAVKEENMNINETDDFGFSLVSEEELRAHEEQLKKKLAEQSYAVEKTSVEYQNKIEGLMAMITPLLNNLMKDPEKEYILWPDRAARIKAFKAKLEKYVKE